MRAWLPVEVGGVTLRHAIKPRLKIFTLYILITARLPVAYLQAPVPLPRPQTNDAVLVDSRSGGVWSISTGSVMSRLSKHLKADQVMVM